MKVYLILLFSFFALCSNGKNVNVLDFGAVPDGKILTTQAIQKAIDECTSSGGGIVTVPVGTFLTGSIYLKSNVNLYIESGATLLGTTDQNDFPGAVVTADQIQNASVTGFGTINGQGFSKNYPITSPRHNDILLYRSKNISVKDITLINSPDWTFRIRECDGVIVQGVRINSYSNQNNDGIDIDGKNIIISNCIIDCEDDAICLKSDNPKSLVENIAITNCIVGTNCNGIKFGTSSYCGFKNISISNCIVRRPSVAAKIPPRSTTLKGCEQDTIMEVGIALEVVDGGFMDQVTISNINMAGIQTPLFIRLGNRHGNGSLKNILISNITATDETMLNSSITGIPGSYVENVILRDIIFKSKGTGSMVEAKAQVPENEKSYPQADIVFGYSVPAYGMYVRHVSNLTMENCVFKLMAPDSRPAVVLDDCHNIRLTDFDMDAPFDDEPFIRLIQSTNIIISGYQSVTPVLTFLKIEGEKSSDIKLTGNDFSQVKNIYDLGSECKASVVREMSNFK